ncbi:GNAT family N-acetyltransferase [Arthrobacter sp. N1]|uniref:GNAT family N-acetyltransferase n=1 Tax=Arthrobacter sp. N1 TaxID=619291 RepID=UPI003BAF0F3D
MTAEELTPAELASLSTRRLRILVNRAYTVIDTDYPPYQALDRYQMLVDELDLRAQVTLTSGVAKTAREKFRDNPLYCRFELFTDGNLAAYVKYTMSGGNLTLVMGTELPGFRDQGADQTLMRNIVLDAHKRRLNLIPRCPMAYAFLADHPQYQQYTGHY